MNKLFTVSVAALGLGLSFMSCDLLPTAVDDKVSISIDAIQTIGSTGTLDIKGSVEGSVEITSIEPKVYDANNTDVTGTLVKISKSVLPTGKKKIDLKTDLGLKLEILSTTCDGSYTLKIVAMAGTAESTQPATFTVSGVNDCTTPVEDTLTPKQVTLGAAAASAGSSLDADNMTVYTSAQVTAAIEPTIDVWFAVTAANEPKLYSPSLAATNNWGPKNWAVKNATTFVKAPASVSFDATKTQTAIDAIWTAGAASAASSVQIAAGDIVIVKTSTGNRILQIVSAGTTTSGTAVITGKIK